MTEKLIFRPPSNEGVSFYYNQQRALKAQRLFAKMKETSKAQTVAEVDEAIQTWDELFSFLANYVEAENKENALELLKRADENSIYAMLKALGGGSDEIPPDLKKTDEESAAGEKDKKTI